MVIALFSINVKSGSNETSSTVHLHRGFLRGVSVFILVDCVPPFLPCFSEIISEVILVKSIFHQRVSQCIISGNNLSFTFHESSLHHSFFYVCLFSGVCCCVTFQFDDVIILSSQESVPQITASKCKKGK